MYQNKKIVAIIPARGGSQGLPGKNIRELNGQPLIAYSIAAALESKYVDRLIVSSDDSKIIALASAHGADVPFRRPPELATAESGSIDVVLHALDFLEKRESQKFDLALLLQPTSPLRTTADIDRAIEMIVEKECDNIIAACPAAKNPYFNLMEKVDERWQLSKAGDHLTRQSAPEVYEINGALYLWWVDILRRERKLLLPGTELYLMERERSVDIDDLIDFKLAELLLKERKDG